MKNTFFKVSILFIIMLLCLSKNFVISATENLEAKTEVDTIPFSENQTKEIYFFTDTENNMIKDENLNITENTKQRIQTALKEQKEEKNKLLTVKVTQSTPVSATENELDILAKIIYAEARGESYTGKLAVGAVVLNRVKSPKYPNTIKGVVFAPGQFSPVRDGSYNKARPTEEEYKAAREALSGSDPTHGALTFYAYKYTKSSYHESLTHTATIGNHKFFK